MSVVSFDGAAMMAALDRERARRALDWNDVAESLWAQSSVLNEELQGDHMCQGALVRTVRRGTMSCQYALIVLRWIDRSPEDFLVGTATDVGDCRLPAAGPDRRLRFDLPALHTALDDRRRADGLTWAAQSETIGCTPNRLTNLRKATLADMGLTMQVTQWLARPAASFVRAERW